MPYADSNSLLALAKSQKMMSKDGSMRLLLVEEKVLEVVKLQRDQRRKEEELAREAIKAKEIETKRLEA